MAACDDVLVNPPAVSGKNREIPFVSAGIWRNATVLSAVCNCLNSVAAYDTDGISMAIGKNQKHKFGGPAIGFAAFVLVDYMIALTTSSWK